MTEPGYPVNTPAAPAAKTSVGLILAIVAASLVAVAAIVVAVWYTSDPQQSIRACEAYIHDNLRSPSTAKFSGEQYFAIEPPEVKGYVDSENGFGAMIRTRFTCTMGKRGGDWVVVDGRAS